MEFSKWFKGEQKDTEQKDVTFEDLGDVESYDTNEALKREIENTENPN